MQILSKQNASRFILRFSSIFSDDIFFLENRAQAKNRGTKPRNRHFDSPNGMFFDESAEQNSIP